MIMAAAELARQEHGEGSHHSIPWEARRFRSSHSSQVRLLILPPGMPQGGAQSPSQEQATLNVGPKL